MTAYSHTLTNLLGTTRQILSESTEIFWSDTVLTAYINSGIKVIAELSTCSRTTKTVYSIPNTREIVYINQYKAVAMEFMKVPRLALMRITPTQLGHIPIDGIFPQYWYEYNGYICIEPIPIYKHKFLIYSIDVPINLVNGADIPDIPLPFRGIIPYYAAARALFQDEKISPANQLMSMFVNELNFLAASTLPTVPNGLTDLRFI